MLLISIAIVILLFLNIYIVFLAFKIEKEIDIEKIIKEIKEKRKCSK